MLNWGLCEAGEADNIKQQNNQQTPYRLLAKKTKANTLRGRDRSKRRDFLANTEPVLDIFTTLSNIFPLQDC